MKFSKSNIKLRCLYQKVLQKYYFFILQAAHILAYELYFDHHEKVQDAFLDDESSEAVISSLRLGDGVKR